MISFCMWLLAFCTVASLTVAIRAHVLGERFSEGWFVLTGLGMLMTTVIVSIMLCNGWR